MRTIWIKHKLVLILVCALIMAWVSFSSLTLQLHQKTSYSIVKQEPVRIQELINEDHGNNKHVEDPVNIKHVKDPVNNTKNIDVVPAVVNKDVVDDKLTSSPSILKKIKHIAKFMHSAKKHVRGSKTSDFLKQASDSMDSLLAELGLKPGDIYGRPIGKSSNVCPEQYMGTTFGYPFFYKGFEITNCTHGVAIWKLVTIIKHIVISKENPNSSIKEIKMFLSSAYKTNSNFSVLLSVNDAKAIGDINAEYPSLRVVDNNDQSEGAALNALVEQIKTPYVFVARNAQMFTNDSRLERLIREIEVIGVKVAGGAIRNSYGHWKKGCFQAVYRNYTLKYLEGYDESLHECLFCDYIQGPFVTSKAYLKNQKFENLNETEGLFEEWFLRIFKNSDEVITCPDSMFHVKSLQTDLYGELKILMEKWNLFKLVTPSGITVTRSCKNEGLSKPRGMALSHCGVQSNADAVKTILRTCEEAGLICELQEGSALGAVKFGKTLPWERDADVTFFTGNYSGFQKLRTSFENQGLRLSDLGSLWCCVDNRTAGGKFMMGYKGWNIELYGQHIMDSELLVLEGIKPSKVLLDGQWVNVPRNPGLFMRNRYGREIYQHAEHWMTTGGHDGWINYKTNMFKKCSDPGSPNCLDRYNADGDLPFIEMLP